jgi:hypothetical protein
LFWRQLCEDNGEDGREWEEAKKRGREEEEGGHRMKRQCRHWTRIVMNANSICDDARLVRFARQSAPTLASRPLKAEQERGDTLKVDCNKKVQLIYNESAGLQREGMKDRERRERTVQTNHSEHRKDSF